jgi:photosystem II stability/assembly factor-like uncharacterized protein
LNPQDERIIYVGSGEANYANHSMYGWGIYKSTDGGDTWRVLGAENFSGRCISKIVIDPGYPGTLYCGVGRAGGFPELASARGHWNARGPLGVWKSTNGGETWVQLSGGIPTDLDCSDIAMHPQNPNTLYAVISRIFGDERNGVYKTVDGGATWRRLAGGLPDKECGRAKLAISPSNPNRVYVSYTKPAGPDGGNATTLGLYRSDDGGETWTKTALRDIHRGSGMYLNSIIVHPQKPDTVFCGGVDLSRSEDGGATWRSVQRNMHADHHHLAYDAAGRLLAATDGGIYRSDDNGDTWTAINNGLGATQFYAGISIQPENPANLIGGLQDNGTVQRTGLGLGDWETLGGADGGYTAIHPEDPNIVFISWQWTGNILKSTQGGKRARQSSRGIVARDRHAFMLPFEFDPTDPSRMIYASHRLYESLDTGDSWFPVSDDLSGGTGAVRGLAMSSQDPNVIYVSTNDGRILVSHDAGRSWLLSLWDIPGWPRVTRPFAIHPANHLVCYFAVSQFGKNQILRTLDGGLNWQSLSANLPNVPVNCVALDTRPDTDHIYLGTDQGVYCSRDGGWRWELYGQNLPNVPVVDLRMDMANRRLVAATQGRGAWEVDLPRGEFTQTIPLHAKELAAESNANGGPAAVCEYSRYLDCPRVNTLALERVIVGAGSRKERWELYNFVAKLWETVAEGESRQAAKRIIRITENAQRFVHKVTGEVRIRAVLETAADKSHPTPILWATLDATYP